MDMQWMKRVDRFAGVPLCSALKVHEKLSSRSEPLRLIDESAEPRLPPDFTGRIAVVKFWGMGSLILAAPLFSALKASCPRAEIHLITLGQNRGIVELLGIADQAHFLDLPSGLGGVAGNILKYFGRVKALGPDAVIDLEYLSRFSAVVSYLSAAPIRVGFHSWDVWRGDLHNVRRAFNPYWHVTRNFLNLHRALTGREITPGAVEIRVTKPAAAQTARMLEAEGIGPDERVIAVNPNASSLALARRWPDSSFVELVDRLVDSGLGRPVLLGAQEEAPYIAALHGKLRHPERVGNLAGKSSLQGLVGLLKRAELLVTNDSGPLHLADALGTRTVSFFGPETPSLYGPRGAGHQVLYRGIDCSPCINIYNAKTVRCMRKAPECLAGISVDEAFAAVTRALENP